MNSRIGLSWAGLGWVAHSSTQAVAVTEFALLPQPRVGGPTVQSAQRFVPFPCVSKRVFERVVSRPLSP